MWFVLLAMLSAVTVTATPLISFAPEGVRVKVHIAPDPANRELLIVVDCDEFYRSSRSLINGEDGPTIVELPIYNLPAGECAVKARVGQAGGAIVDSNTVRLIRQ